MTLKLHPKTTGVLRAHNQLCRQRHLWGYRSRTLNPNPKTHHNPIFKGYGCVQDGPAPNAY